MKFHIILYPSFRHQTKWHKEKKQIVECRLFSSSSRLHVNSSFLCCCFSFALHFPVSFSICHRTYTHVVSCCSISSYDINYKWNPQHHQAQCASTVHKHKHTVYTHSASGSMCMCVVYQQSVYFKNYIYTNKNETRERKNTDQTFSVS